jgi:hypothetical protein
VAASDAAETVAAKLGLSSSSIIICTYSYRCLERPTKYHSYISWNEEEAIMTVLETELVCNLSALIKVILQEREMYSLLFEPTTLHKAQVSSDTAFARQPPTIRPGHANYPHL